MSTRKNRKWSFVAYGATAAIVAMVVFSSIAHNAGAGSPRTIDAGQPLATAGVSYFVDSLMGSDSNPGTSAAQPWQTFAPVNKHTFQPGDALNFKAGTEYTGMLQVYGSGVEGNPITVRSYGSGPRPALHNPTAGGTAIQVAGSFVVIDGVQVTNAQEYGIDLRGDHVTVQNVEIGYTGIGVVMKGQYDLLTHSYLHDGQMVVNTPGGNDDYGAVGVVLYSGNNEVSYNRFENLIARSDDYGQDGGAVEIYGNVSHSSIHHNWARNCKGFVEVGGGTVSNDLFAYNVIVDCGRLALFNLTGTHGATVQNVRIENNTMAETVDRGTHVGWWYAAVAWDASPAAGSVSLRNNVICLNTWQKVANDTPPTHDHNLLFFSQGNYPVSVGYTLGTGERVADPRFVNDSADFHLLAVSPAIGAGAAPASYGSDYDGKGVPSVNGVDIGAYQFYLANRSAFMPFTARP